MVAQTRLFSPFSLLGSFPYLAYFLIYSPKTNISWNPQMKICQKFLNYILVKFEWKVTTVSISAEKERKCNAHSLPPGCVSAGWYNYRPKFLKISEIYKIIVLKKKDFDWGPEIIDFPVRNEVKMIDSRKIAMLRNSLNIKHTWNSRQLW